MGTLTDEIPRFTDEEGAAVQAVQPGLIRVAPNALEGELILNASFEDVVIQDIFRIRLTAAKPPQRVPRLQEIGGRTEQIADKHGLTDLRDLHRNTDGTACVCVRPMERVKFPPGSDLLVFLNELAIPYLYGLSHFERHRTWPWGEYSHGALGIFEFYADPNAKVVKSDIPELTAHISREANGQDFLDELMNPNGKRACPCGSDKAFELCHDTAWRGLVRLNAAPSS